MYQVLDLKPKARQGKLPVKAEQTPTLAGELTEEEREKIVASLKQFRQQLGKR